MRRSRPISTQNRYAAIIEAIFLAKHEHGQREVAFELHFQKASWRERRKEKLGLFDRLDEASTDSF